MDRQQMQIFIENIYQQGRESVPGIDVKNIKGIVMDIKGIGEKKAELIEQKIQESFNNSRKKK